MNDPLSVNAKGCQVTQCEHGWGGGDQCLFPGQAAHKIAAMRYAARPRGLLPCVGGWDTCSLVFCAIEMRGPFFET